ncbi:uncharacterized protein L201_000819 [Kwoniella dendrophila CBS 6074]|uniref:Peptidase A1 domain-containing protein n=1 Tax=Kwoniella dendrophila CBS 6074 TaxID=1295534 RepID=A0AAX4JKN0_9TREE
MLTRVIVFIISLACLVHAQISLPIIPDPSFQLLSGEIIVAQQLNSWGIKIGPISLNLGLDLGVLGLKLKKKRDDENRRSRIRSFTGTETELLANQLEQENGKIENESKKRLLGLDLGLLNLGLNFGGSKTSSSGQSKSKALIILNLDTDLSKLFSWGDADNVAKGERGDTEWFTYISIGTPPQSLPILPDTGSSDLFIFGPDCSSCNLNTHNYFKPNQSTTYKNISDNWNFYYADGSGALGYTSSDILSFGSENNKMVSTEMKFAISTEIGGINKDDFKQSQRSGVLGLGLDSMSTIKQGSTLFSNLVKSNQLTENILSIRLQKGKQYQGNFYEEGQGQYTLGGIEENYVVNGRNGLTWTDVQSQYYWGITMDDILVGSNSVLNQDTTTPRRAIIDTGTTLIITSNSASSLIHGNIMGSWQDAQSSIWYIPCTTSYPSTGNIFFSISGRKFGVPISDLAWKKSGQYNGMCISGVQGGMDGFTVLGDMFIKNHYVVLSYGSEQDGNKIQVGLGDRTDIPTIL